MSDAAATATSEPAPQKHPIYCSFCGKGEVEVALLIAGPRVFICNECVELCVVILVDQGVPMDLLPTRAPMNAQEVCPHGVRDPHACHICTPRDAA